MKFEQTDPYINGAERQAYLVKVQIFTEGTLPTGAISDETEAQRLY